MTEEEHKMLKESHKAARRVEEYLFGTEAEIKQKKRPRSNYLDSMIFGVDAGKLGYRIILGLAALVVAIGTVWATIKGWKL